VVQYNQDPDHVVALKLADRARDLMEELMAFAMHLQNKTPTYPSVPLGRTTSPSGKTLFVCLGCGQKQPWPHGKDHVCPTTCPEKEKPAADPTAAEPTVGRVVCSREMTSQEFLEDAAEQCARDAQFSDG
jgi:hypothetical protein